MTTPAGTAVITGGTKGLGRALTWAFARRGYRVLALYHADAPAAARLDAELAAAGWRARTQRHDVLDVRDDAPLWAAPEIREGGRLVLVHNAGAPFVPQPLHLLAWDDFERSLAVALRGAWACSRALLRPMLSRGDGCIVTVLSSAVHGLPPKGFAAYAAAKSALRSFTQSLAAEYGARGLKIFSVSPGFMQTPLTNEWPRALQDAVRRTGEADPVAVAERIVDLVDHPGTPGCGEDYPVP